MNRLGEEIGDETIHLNITVSRDDIENGLRGKADSCPIALGIIHACKEQFKTEPYDLEVDIGNISFFLDGYEYRLYDNLLIENFITAFDKEEWVEPFQREFEFEQYYRDFLDD